jgi:molybdopterin-guanine dinucleotide biosynthesis protein A
MVLQETGVTGFALAGGRSRRMGRDKALLPYAETTYLDHAVRRLRAVCGKVLILSGANPRYEELHVPVLTDPGIGPLGAILAGLSHSPWGLFLAVDLPEIPIGLLEHLARGTGDHDAVVPLSARGPEPLCAVYGPACREAIARCLEAEERRATAFFDEVRIRYLSPRELEAFGDPDLLFRNVNTPEDYARSTTGG